MKALIDGDILVYRCGFAAEHKHYRIYIKGEEAMGYIASLPSKKECDTYIEEHCKGLDIVIEPFIEVEPVGNALSNVKNTIEAILDAVKATKYILYLTGTGNYREDLVDYYKANRKDVRKPTWYKEIREYLINQWGGEIVEGMEADDAMGIAQVSSIDTSKVMSMYASVEDCRLDRYGNTIICTLDKDLNMIPGWHYNWVKQTKYWVTENEATLFYYTQLLTGDATDNIAGIPGCGPVKARKILEGASTELDMYANCLAEYEINYPTLGKDKLMENAHLLWILREEHKFWQPPKI